MLYLVTASTGLRASELASLRACDFLLEGDSPAIRLAAADEKSKNGVEQPVPPGLVPELQHYLAKISPLEKVWPSTWPEKAWAMIRHDLKAANIPQQTSEGYFDFHAWRHTYITLLSQSSLQPKMVQDLARHSDIRLTMSRYAHTQRQQRSLAVRNSFPLPFPLQGANSGELVIRSENESKQKRPGNKAKRVLPTRFELVTYGLGNRSGISKTAVNTGVCTHCKSIPLAIPLELLSIIKAWEQLPQRIKDAIKALAT